MSTAMDLLTEELGKLLPQKTFKLWYAQSTPTRVKPLLNGDSTVKSFKIRHFFQLLLNDVIIFGIEIFTYLQIHSLHVDHYVFIPKCDTIGLLPLDFKIGPIISKILKFVLKYDISDYVLPSISTKRESLSINHTTHFLIQTLKERIQDGLVILSYGNKHERSLLGLVNVADSGTSSLPDSLKSVQTSKTSVPANDIDGTKSNLNFDSTKSNSTIVLPSTVNTKLTLFTRASHQYIYPESSKNPHKHLIDGTHLLSWWLKVIDSSLSDDWSKLLMIPGGDTSRFLFGEWKEGHIFNNNPDYSIYTIPLLPDDPKGRFLEHLIVENRYMSVNVEQFYYELGFRQEFRLGDLVGLIGCEKKDNRAKGDKIIEDTLNDSQKYENSKPNNCINITKISLKNYKQIMNEIKSTDCNREEELQNLINVKIPEINAKYGSGVNIYEIKGKNEVKSIDKKRELVKPVNNLTGLIKRKKVKPT